MLANGKSFQPSLKSVSCVLTKLGFLRAVCTSFTRHQQRDEMETGEDWLVCRTWIDSMLEKIFYNTFFVPVRLLRGVSFYGLEKFDPVPLMRHAVGKAFKM